MSKSVWWSSQKRFSLRNRWATINITRQILAIISQLPIGKSEFLELLWLQSDVDSQSQDLFTKSLIYFGSDWPISFNSFCMLFNIMRSCCNLTGFYLIQKTSLSWVVPSSVVWVEIELSLNYFFGWVTG